MEAVRMGGMEAAFGWLGNYWSYQSSSMSPSALLVGYHLLSLLTSSCCCSGAVFEAETSVCPDWWVRTWVRVGHSPIIRMASAFPDVPVIRSHSKTISSHFLAGHCLCLFIKSCLGIWVLWMLSLFDSNIRKKRLQCSWGEENKRSQLCLWASNRSSVGLDAM